MPLQPLSLNLLSKTIRRALPLALLGFSTLARFVGETRNGEIEVPSYTVFDLMAQYDFTRQWRAQLNVQNLADKEYVASCDYWCYYSEGRSVVGSVSYRW